MPSGPLSPRSIRGGRLLEPIGAAVDVDPLAAGESAEGEAVLAGEPNGQRGRCPYSHQHRGAGDDRLLDELERQPATDAQDVARERHASVLERPADHLVHRVVAADVLTDADELDA